jgi:hypothetical protein
MNLGAMIFSLDGVLTNSNGNFIVEFFCFQDFYSTWLDGPVLCTVPCWILFQNSLRK